jgi:hypothetical protein
MIKKLNQRERYVVLGGAIVLVLLLIIFGVVIPFRAANKRLDTRISALQGQLVEVGKLQADYLVLKDQNVRLQSELDKGASTQPVTFLEQTASRIGGRENLVLMRPLPSVTQGQLRIETTEFKMEHLGLEKVLRILKAVEQASPPMRVDRLHLKKRFDNAAQLDMAVTVSAPRRN